MRNNGSAPGRLTVAAVLGPIAALVHETDAWPAPIPATLLPVLIVVLAALAGLVLAVRGGRRPRTLKWLGILSNGSVLALYGFFLLFFGLGGSR